MEWLEYLTRLCLVVTGCLPEPGLLLRRNWVSYYIVLIICIKYAKQNILFHGSKYKTRRGVITHPDFDVSLFRIATIAWLSMWKLFSYFLICYPINWSQKLQVQIRGQSCLSTPNFVAMGKNTNSPLKYAPQMKWDDPELYVIISSLPIQKYMTLLNDFRKLIRMCKSSNSDLIIKYLLECCLVLNQEML